MQRQFVLFTLILFALLTFVACTGVAPQAVQETASNSEPAAAADDAAEASAGAVSPVDDEEVVTYTVDNQASNVEWYGSKPVGASESGTVEVAEGHLRFDGSELVEGEIVVDMTTIATTSQSGNMAERLVGHLSSDEFFGVETYPTATLVIKSAEPTAVDDQYRVTADLTIKETTDEIEFITDVAVGAETLEATADIVVDRSIYDVRYGSGTFFSNLGDDLISDEMEFTVNLVATR